ncbi:MAG: hypothetical protein WCX65_06980 [bacterium]
MPEIDAASLTEMQKLFSGVGLTSNKVNCSPLCEKHEIATLKELIERYKRGCNSTGREDAQKFLSDVSKICGEQPVEQAPDIKKDAKISGNLEEQQDRQIPKPNWRLHQLRAQNFKGLTEWNGDSFEHDFEGKPYFVFGHNSTGKTSILSSVTWCMTGSYIKDLATGKSENIEIFTNDSKNRCTKTWPGYVTLPHKLKSDEFKKCIPECFVQCELKDEKERILTVKRTFKDGTIEETILLDGTKTSLTEVGITALELDIAFLLPHRVNSIGTIGHETIADSLIAVAGLEALKNIGSMAEGMARSVAALNTSWSNEADSFIKQARETLTLLMKEILETEKEITIRNIDNALKKTSSEDDMEFQKRLCEEKSKSFEATATEAFNVIKNSLGIIDETLTSSKREEIVKDIRDAQVAIGINADNWDIIRSWTQVTTDVISTRISLEKIADGITESLAKSYPLWQKDKDQRGKLAVQLKAAYFLKQQGEFEKCPICDNQLTEETKSRLKKLSEEEENALLDLKIKLDSHIKSINEAIPKEIQQLTIGNPKLIYEKCVNDNIGLHLDKFPVFKTRLESLNKSISDLPDREYPSKIKRFISIEWDNEYSIIFDKLEKLWLESQNKIALAEWIQKYFDSIKEVIRKTIYDDEGPIDDELPSILFSLNELEKHLKGYKDLERESKVFQEAANLFGNAKKNRQNAEFADLIHKTLRNIKQLKDHAKNMLIKITDSISENIGEIFDKLYGPYDPVKTDKLVDKCSRKGGKLDICLLLKWTDDLYADAEAISNAGKLRAILWAFSFALLEMHRPSVNIVILDDSTVYFDINRSDNMIKEIIKDRLMTKNRFQVLATVFDENLLHSIFPKNISGKNIGILETLPRAGIWRGCWTKPKLEPLAHAIEEYGGDNSKWKPVLEETRKYFERFMKLILRYLKENDCSSMNFGELAECLRQVKEGNGKNTPLSSKIDINKLVVICDGIELRILHCTHHGGPDESKFVPDDAKDVVANYKRWRTCIDGVYDSIQEILRRSESTACVKAEEYQSSNTFPTTNYTRFKPDKEASLIGRVAAEGDVTIYADESDEVELQKWPELLCARATTDYGKPVIWEGQTGLFSEQIPTKEGDIALVACSGKTYLRRVFKVNLSDETEQGWVGQILNTNIRDIPPIISRHDDKTLPLVGVLYTNEPIGRISAPDDSELEPLENWNDIMKKIAAGKIMLVHVNGSSAEPVALHGQYLLVQETTIGHIKEDNIYCVLLDDNRGVFKRWRSLQNQPSKILLQSINTIDPHFSIEEVILDGAANPTGLPVVKRVLQVHGVMFESPESLLEFTG